MEEKEGNHHCWLPSDVKKMMNYINNEKKIEGSFKKDYSKEEKMRESLEQILQMV